MELDLLKFINNVTAVPALDTPMATLSNWAVWMPIVAILAIGLAVFGNFHTRAMILTALVAVGMSDGLVCKTLKSAVGRARPHDAMEGIRMVDLAKASPRLLAVVQPVKTSISASPAKVNRGRSFPSSHAANCFAVAMVCFLFLRRGRWLTFLPATLVAYSRVYTGSHWPSDVAAGALIGCFCGWAATALLGVIWTKTGPRFFPALYSRHPEPTKP